MRYPGDSAGTSMPESRHSADIVGSQVLRPEGIHVLLVRVGADQCPALSRGDREPGFPDSSIPCGSGADTMECMSTEF
jgi:hypothetical protein